MRKCRRHLPRSSSARGPAQTKEARRNISRRARAFESREGPERRRDELRRAPRSRRTLRTLRSSDRRSRPSSPRYSVPPRFPRRSRRFVLPPLPANQRRRRRRREDDVVVLADGANDVALFERFLPRASTQIQRLASRQVREGAPARRETRESSPAVLSVRARGRVAEDGRERLGGERRRRRDRGDDHARILATRERCPTRNPSTDDPRCDARAPRVRVRRDVETPRSWRAPRDARARRRTRRRARTGETEPGEEAASSTPPPGARATTRSSRNGREVDGRCSSRARNGGEGVDHLAGGRATIATDHQRPRRRSARSPSAGARAADESRGARGASSSKPRAAAGTESSRRCTGRRGSGDVEATLGDAGAGEARRWAAGDQPPRRARARRPRVDRV